MYIGIIKCKYGLLALDGGGEVVMVGGGGGGTDTGFQSLHRRIYGAHGVEGVIAQKNSTVVKY